jgi:hypothetical protein
MPLPLESGEGIVPWSKQMTDGRQMALHGRGRVRLAKLLDIGRHVHRVDARDRRDACVAAPLDEAAHVARVGAAGVRVAVTGSGPSPLPFRESTPGGQTLRFYQRGARRRRPNGFPPYGLSSKRTACVCFVRSASVLGPATRLFSPFSTTIDSRALSSSPQYGQNLMICADAAIMA